MPKLVGQIFIFSQFPPSLLFISSVPISFGPYSFTLSSSSLLHLHHLFSIFSPPFLSHLSSHRYLLCSSSSSSLVLHLSSIFSLPILSHLLISNFSTLLFHYLFSVHLPFIFFLPILSHLFSHRHLITLSSILSPLVSPSSPLSSPLRRHPKWCPTVADH